jgi:hypothetical protein
MGAYVQCSETNTQSCLRFYIIGDGCLKIKHACILSEQFYMSYGRQPHGDLLGLQIETLLWGPAWNNIKALWKYLRRIT